MIRNYVYALLGILAVGLLFRGMNATPAVAPGAETSLPAFLVPVARLFVETFNNSTTAILISLAMIVIGLALLAYYWFARITPIVHDLRAVKEGLDRTPAPATMESLAGIDAVMSRYEVLSRNWQLYRNTLVKSDNGSVVARVTPDRYFDFSTLRLRLRFYLGLPNDFVGVGLIFTFLGLVAGLYFATRSMMSPDLGVARDALVQLLHAATFKFLTSITGIGMSLLISWVQRHQLGALEAELAEIRYLIEQRLPYLGTGITDRSTSNVTPLQVVQARAGA